MTRARDPALTLPMPTADPMAGEEGPCTPSPFEIKSLAYGRPRHLPIPTSVSNGSVTSDCSTGASEHSASSAASDEPLTPASGMAGLALSSCDVTPLSSPLVSPPSATVTGKRHRDEWTMDEVQLLENILARPPQDLHFPPGSMPPPEVLDGLTNAILETIGSGDSRGDVSSRATSPALAIGSLDLDYSTIDAWPHSWDETRHKLAALALANTRLGAELANRKLTRQERLARPGIKRVGSMDYLEDEEQAMPSERIGRVLRLSTTLQNSAKGIDAASVARSPSSRSLSLNAASTSKADPPPMKRTLSGLSIGSSSSRRPSLLARGRSFTAKDLEAEAAQSSPPKWHTDGDIVMADVGFGVGKCVEPPEEISPRTPTDAVFAQAAPVPVLPAAENTPAVEVSGPSPPDPTESKLQSPPHKRRVQPPPLGRSKSYTASEREAHLRRDSFLAPPLPKAPPPAARDKSSTKGLQGAFEWSAPGSATVPAGWESEDSDRERDSRESSAVAIKKPQRKMRGTLAMTALNAAAAGRSDSSSSSSSRGSRSGSLSTSSDDGLGSGACTPPLVISTMVDEAARARGEELRSPFEEREVELA